MHPVRPAGRPWACPSAWDRSGCARSIPGRSATVVPASAADNLCSRGDNGHSAQYGVCSLSGGIVAPAHPGAGSGFATESRKLGSHCLRGGQLIFTAVRHQNSACADGGVKLLAQSLLAADVQVDSQVLQLLRCQSGGPVWGCRRFCNGDVSGVTAPLEFRNSGRGQRWCCRSSLRRPAFPWYGATMVASRFSSAGVLDELLGILGATATAIRSWLSLMASSVPSRPSYFLGTAFRSISGRRPARRWQRKHRLRRSRCSA